MPSRILADSTTEPWHLTVVSCSDILFLRPQKSWKPIVGVLVAGRDSPHEVVLGSDGRNPNMKASILLPEISHATKLDVKVWHKPASTKGRNRKKRQLVGTACTSVGELLVRQKRSDADVSLPLCSPKQQKGSMPVKSVQRGRARLILRLRPPSAGSSQETSCGSSVTAVDTPLQSDAEDDAELSTATASETETFLDENEVIRPAFNQNLRHRRSIKGYRIDSEDEDAISNESLSPTEYHTFHRPFHIDHASDCEESCAPALLPRHAGEPSETPRALSRVERFVDVFAPYSELKLAAEGDDVCAMEAILRGLAAEWQPIGAALLALCGIDAAIFGYQTGTLFPIDGLMQRVVAGGAIVAAFGLVCDAWFLMYYSGASGAKFKTLALDVYGSYVFFCLACRMPTLCMLLAAVALMVFVVGVAWTYYPGLVLVLCFLAGMCTTLQYLVFGFHWLFGFCVDVARRAWVLVTGRRGHGARAREGAVPPVREAVRATPAGEVPVPGARD